MLSITSADASLAQSATSVRSGLGEDELLFEQRFAKLEAALMEQGKVMRSLISKLQASGSLNEKGNGSAHEELLMSWRAAPLQPSTNHAEALFQVTGFDPSLGLSTLQQSFAKRVRRASTVNVNPSDPCVEGVSMGNNNSGSAVSQPLDKDRHRASTVRDKSRDETYGTDDKFVVAVDAMYFIFTVIAIIASSNAMSEVNGAGGGDRNKNALPEVYELVLLGVCQLYFAAWIFTRLSLRFCQEWTVVCERDVIRHHYFSSYQWWLDLFITIPFEFVFVGWANFWFRVLSLRHCLRLIRAWSLTASSDPLFPVREQFRLSYLFALATVIIHGISLFLRGNAQVNADYVQSLYYIVGIFTTVGYSDLNAAGDEFIKAFACVVMPVGTMVLGFAVAMVITHVATMDKLESEMNMKRLRLASILSHYNIPWELQKDIIIHFSSNIDKDNHTEMKEFLKSLPYDVTGKLELFLRVRFLRNMRAFASLTGPEDADALAALGAALIPRYFTAGDCVFVKGEPGDELFIIRHGIVEVSVPKNGTNIVHSDSEGEDSGADDVVVATLSDGQMFGEVAVVERGPRMATVTTLVPSELLVLSASALSTISAQYPQVGRLVESFSVDRRNSAPS